MKIWWWCCDDRLHFAIMTGTDGQTTASKIKPDACRLAIRKSTLANVLQIFVFQFLRLPVLCLEQSTREQFFDIHLFILSPFQKWTNEPILNWKRNFQQDGSLASAAGWLYGICMVPCAVIPFIQKLVARKTCFVSIQSVVVNCNVESCSSLQSHRYFPNLHILHSQFYQSTGLQWGL